MGFLNQMRAKLLKFMETLGIADEHDQEPLNDHEDNPCLTIVKRFQSHPSVFKITSSVKSTIYSSFRRIKVEEMLEKLQNFDPKKGSPQEAIPAKYQSPTQICFVFLSRSVLITLLRKAASQMI